MPLARAIEYSDGSIEIMYANPRLRRQGESEATLLSRLADAAPPAKGGARVKRVIEVDPTTLPPRESKIGNDEYDLRVAWRLTDDGVVEVDDTKKKLIIRPGDSS